MAEIIRNTVQKTLEQKGRTREWFAEQLKLEGIMMNSPRLSNIMCNSGTSIFLHELRVIAHILKVENIQDLLEHEYKSNIE